MSLYEVVCKDRDCVVKSKYLSAPDMSSVEDEFRVLEPDLVFIEAKALF